MKGVTTFLVFPTLHRTGKVAKKSCALELRKCRLENNLCERGFANVYRMCIVLWWLNLVGKVYISWQYMY